MKGIREAKGFTLKELSKRSGIITTTLEEYEFGVSEPRLRNLERLIDALEVTCDYLLGIPEEDLRSFRVEASRMALYYLAVERARGHKYWVSSFSESVYELASRPDAPVTIEGWRNSKEILRYPPFNLKKAKVLPWRPKEAR